jgi:hypothetical protein
MTQYPKFSQTPVSIHCGQNVENEVWHLLVSVATIAIDCPTRKPCCQLGKVAKESDNDLCNLLNCTGVGYTASSELEFDV